MEGFEEVAHGAEKARIGVENGLLSVVAVEHGDYFGKDRHLFDGGLVGFAGCVVGFAGAFHPYDKVGDLVIDGVVEVLERAESGLAQLQ